MSLDGVSADGGGLVILVPMLGRAHRVVPLVESIRDATPEADVLFLLTPGDRAVHDAVARVGCRAEIVQYRPVGDYARKINHGVRCTSAPLVFTGADDLRFHRGWFGAAVGVLDGRDGVGVVGTNDLGNPRVVAGEHATHFLVTRWYAQIGIIDGREGLMCPDYPHEFVDDEFVGTAKHRGMWEMSTESVVEHLHPNWGKAKNDALYQQQHVRMRMGQGIYRKRMPLWT